MPIDLEYFPDENDFRCRFYVEPAYGIAFDAAVENIIAESSVGTCEIEGARTKKFAAKVYAMDPRGGIVDCAYPIEALEPMNVPQIVSMIAGSALEMRSVSGLKLIDITIPRKMLKAFAGPLHGVDGIRRLLRIKQRPIIIAAIEPKVGLSAGDYASIALNAWLGGVDVVEDSESLCGQKFCDFKKRVLLTLRARDRAERKTGERKIYFPNITAETEEMLRRAQFIEKAGCECAMVNAMTVGWSALQTLCAANKKLKLILNAHRAGHAALARSPKHGISTLVLAKLCRMLGFDQFHIGTPIGKMAMNAEEAKRCCSALRATKVPQDEFALGQDWGKIKPTLPVCSGGLHPGHIPFLIESLGQDIGIQMSSGIHRHPRGTYYGAIATRQAIDAVMQGTTLKEWARAHDELREALAKFA